MQSQDDPAQRWWRRPRTRAWDRKKGTGGAREAGERGGAEGDTGTVLTVGFRVQLQGWPSLKDRELRDHLLLSV